MYYLPVLGALALAGGTIFERKILKGRKISVSSYNTAGFLAIVLIMLPFLYFFWKLDAGAFETKNIIIFLLVVIFSIIANLFSFYSLKNEKVTNTEPARILEPFFIILLAIIFSFFIDGVYERNVKIIIPALIAALALVFSHIKRHHLEFNKPFVFAVLGSLFFAIELVLSKLILEFYSSMTFYFLRCTAIFLVSFMIFKPNLFKIENKLKLKIFFVGIIWVVYRIVLYQGYLKLGIVFTTLIIMLGPVFVYLFAYIFLKEKMTWKNVVASVIIVGCVVYAVVV